MTSTDRSSAATSAAHHPVPGKSTRRRTRPVFTSTSDSALVLPPAPAAVASTFAQVMVTAVPARLKTLASQRCPGSVSMVSSPVARWRRKTWVASLPPRSRSKTMMLGSAGRKLPLRVGSSAVVTCFSACPGASLRCSCARSAPLAPARHTASRRWPSGVMSANEAPRNSVYGPTRAGRLAGTGGTPVMVRAAGGVTTARPCCVGVEVEQAARTAPAAPAATARSALQGCRWGSFTGFVIIPPSPPTSPATRSTPPASQTRWRSRPAPRAWSCGARGSPRRRPARRRAAPPGAPDHAACPA